MFFNMAKNNIKKSFKDYTIYFLTLSFAVCIFYAFNSIGSQTAMTQISEQGKEILSVMSNITGALSVFVSVILGALIIYANNFLIKRRKKELGIYMTLGMGKGKISRILVIETLMVGVISLVVGLIGGLVVSQGLSLLTAKLFGGEITKLAFVISYSAILKTIIYFGIIFLLVMIFNTVIVSKYKLIDLLTAGRKNEKIKIKNPVLLFVIFIIGVILLVSGYYTITKYGMEQMSMFSLALGLGTVGTFLFFYGLAGFFVVITQKNKNRYLRGLNIFVTKQMNSKINTNFVSMSLISLMLFVTISALSTGVSFKSSLEASLSKATPYDISTSVYDNGNLTNKQVEDYVQKIYNIPQNELKTVVLESNYIDKSLSIDSASGSFTTQYGASYMTLSNYNKYREFYGEAPITLNDNQVILTSNTSNVDKLNKVLESSTQLSYNGHKYTVANSKVSEDTFEDATAPVNQLTIIVPDNFVQVNKAALGDDTPSITINSNVINKADSDKIQTQIINNYDAATKAAQKLTKEQRENAPTYMISTQNSIKEQSQGMTTVVLYITIYLGVIFLITSSAIIALQQLVEATDSKGRYDILRKIGATDKMINKAILKQIAIAFIMPLALAIVDAVVAINVVSKFIQNFGKSSIVGPSVITAVIIILIYGGYMLATYFGFKNTVKDNK
ncbi:MAG: ABC transporter permease [Sarcina sp.]